MQISDDTRYLHSATLFGLTSLIDFLLLIDTQTTRTHIYEQQKSANNRESLEKVVPNVTQIQCRKEILEEISMRMRSGHTPKIIHDNIRHAQQCNEEDGRILGLESNCDHNACKKPDRAERNPSDTPRPTAEDKPEEKENEQDSSGELKVGSVRGVWVR